MRSLRVVFFSLTAVAVVSMVSHTFAQAPPSAEMKAARAKLSATDRKLVEAQEYCAINNTERLGEMGDIIKVMVKNQPVFLCCKGCVTRATNNPDQTLAKVEELKTKVRAEAKKK